MHEKKEIYASGEDYLEAILVLQEKKGMVRSVDLARYMDFSKPSISHAVAVLRKGGYLVKDMDGFICLTEKGRQIAEKIYERHRVITYMLVSLGVPDNIAESDACRIEHCISEESFEKLKKAFKDVIQ